MGRDALETVWTVRLTFLKEKHYNLANLQFLEVFNVSHHLNITIQVSLTNKNVFFYQIMLLLLPCVGN